MLLPNSGPKCREAPGGQSNADLHPTRGDCTPLPLSCHLQVMIAWCFPPMTRCWLPHGQRHSEALMGTQARLRVAKGEDTSSLVCVCACLIALNASVRDSVNTSNMCVRDSVRCEYERSRQHIVCACTCLCYIGVCVQVSSCAHNNRAIAPAFLPWRLLCYSVYGRRHHNTCPIFPQSPLHGIGPPSITGI